VWGLFALDRGMWQDELVFMTWIQDKTGEPLAQLVSASGTPTRVFAKIPFTLAYWSGAIVPSLQAFYGLIWVFTGVLVHLLLRRAFPGQAVLSYLGGALTLASTSDFLTNSLVPLNQLASVTAYLLSLLLLLRWWHEDAWPWLLAAAFCLQCSLWTYDAAFVSVLLTPVLLWAYDGFRVSRRVLGVGGFWYTLVAPYLVVLHGFFTDPNAYAAVALRPLSVMARLQGTWRMFCHNFAPWDWAWYRPLWFPAPPPALSCSFKALVALLGTVVFVAVLARLRRPPHAARQLPKAVGRRLLVAVAACLLLAFGSNAQSSSVHYSEVFMRTHWASRVWSSVAVALVSFWLGGIAPGRWKPATFMLPTLFVCLGIYGGVERQDYFLGYWRRHAAELRSIVEQVPGMSPDGHLILVVPEAKPYMATEAEYLARAWMAYLLEDRSLFPRVALWSADRRTVGRLDGSEFVSLGEGRVESRIPVAKSVVLLYVDEENRFVLQKTLPTGVLGPSAAECRDYAPRSQVVDRPMPRTARSLLYRSEYLAALFPEVAWPRQPSTD
jgi:hypothetical protein